MTTGTRKSGLLWIAAPLLALLASTAWAQTAGSTIQGTVKDQQGGAMPGVTVTVSAPELQVGKISAVTEADGNYRVGDLPAGTYQIVFGLEGFKPIIQKDFRLTIGFVARVDAVMTVGALEESVTVSGASPVIDLTTTSTSSTITRETLDSVPVGQGLLNLYAMTPGLTTVNVDVGDSLVGKRTSSENYGPSMNATIRIDGIDIADGANTSVYLSSSTLDEMQIRTSGNDAEVSTPGTVMMGVIKSGSNEFHGTYNVDTERPQLQSNNISPALRAQGLSNTNPIAHLDDESGDLGGRIFRDKLWFYAALSRQDRVAGVPGFSAISPDPATGTFSGNNSAATVEARMLFAALKLSYQPTPGNRFIVAFQPTDKHQPQGLPPEPSRFVNLPSTLDYHNPTAMDKAEYQSTLSPHTVFDIVGGYSGYLGDYAPWRSKFAGPDDPSNPSRFDIATQIHTGANPKTVIQYQNNWHFNSSIAWLPDKFLGGRHELKFGTEENWHKAQSGMRVNPAGDYILNTDSGTATQVQVYNSPAIPDPRSATYAGFIQDSWKVSNSLTANIGLRIEKQRAFLPKQTRQASPDFPSLFPAATVPATDIMTWWDAVPRLGLAWNLAEKTVVKGTYARYGQGITPAIANAYNPINTVQDVFKWHDLNRNLLWDPGEVNLDTNGVDFVSTNAVTTNALNKNLKQPMINESTASFERELGHGFGFRALYVFKQVTDLYATTNVLRPTSAYSIPLTRLDPGPSGVLGTSNLGPVAILDFDPAYAGSKFVQNTLQNFPGQTDHFQTTEFTVTKHGGRKYSLTASWWAVKWHQHLNLAPAGCYSSTGTTTTCDPNNPNNNAFNLDQTYRWASTASGSYELPFGVQFGVHVQSKIGIQSQRIGIFRAADPNGGPSLKQQTNVVMRLSPMGSVQGSAINDVDVRTSKSFPLGKGGRRIEFDFDLFNVTNSVAPFAVTFVEGPTYGYVTDATPPRIARVGLRFSF